MIRPLLIILFSFSILFASSGQENIREWTYPVEEGRIRYLYSGNTEGSRDLYFRSFGKEQALQTELVRNSTFFAITNETPENVREFLVNGRHYHFDLDSKRGSVLDFPINLMYKYFRIPADKGISRGLVDLGARIVGEEKVLDFDCEKWVYRNREFWLWKGVLLKMRSSGLNKMYNMEAIEVDFENSLPDSLFVFPKDIPVKK